MFRALNADCRVANNFPKRAATGRRPLTPGLRRRLRIQKDAIGVNLADPVRWCQDSFYRATLNLKAVVFSLTGYEDLTRDEGEAVSILINGSSGQTIAAHIVAIHP